MSNTENSGFMGGVKKLQDKIEHFSVTETADGAYKSTNKAFRSVLPESVAPKSESEPVTEGFKRPFHVASDYSQKEFPYFSNLCRSHYMEIIGVSAVIGGLMVLAYKRPAPAKRVLGGIFFGGVSSLGVVTVVNHKFWFPPK